MSIIKVETRGNTVRFTATFKDFDGNVTAPGSAHVYLTFEGGTETVAMTTNTAGDFVATWDTSPADPGTVFWTVKASSPSIARDGRFELSANASNPAP